MTDAPNEPDARRESDVEPADETAQVAMKPAKKSKKRGKSGAKKPGAKKPGGGGGGGGI
ncbi:hypothetical protein [Pseudolysinimonas sp.]|uniref:hypothetical protein n=1 Tax=Pseudolysinimonas sp. TaxID=2680009 RepID=UPI00286B24D7|nr:hypothetical protein [Pseudolysinimonas sp.]